MTVADILSRHIISRVFKIWAEWTAYIGVTCLAEETTFDLLGTLDSGEGSLPFGLLVICIGSI